MQHRYAMEAGNLADLQKQSFQLDDPAAHEVQVAVKAIGLNFADVFASNTPE